MIELAEMLQKTSCGTHAKWLGRFDLYLQDCMHHFGMAAHTISHGWISYSYGSNKAFSRILFSNYVLLFVSCSRKSVAYLT